MKKRFLGMLAATGLGLALLAGASVFSGAAGVAGDRFSRERLFSAEPWLRGVSALLAPLGISVEPRKVVVGRSGWLFLGDEGWGSLSAHRSPANPQDGQLGRLYGEGAGRWNTWLQSRGVKSFRIMVAPDKETVYAEQLPDWARLTGVTHADAVVGAASSPLFVDTRATLQAAARQTPTDVYFRTDTHWNAVGAARAFEQWAAEVQRSSVALTWPNAHDRAMIGEVANAQGDLARVLRWQVTDPVPRLGVSGLARNLEHRRYDTNEPVDAAVAGNAAAEPRFPLRIRNPNALNQRKLLWLSDSFGRAMDDMVLRTFSDVVRLHWRDVHQEGGWFVRLVQEWQPDVVLVTVAERSLTTPAFANVLQFAPASVENERPVSGSVEPFDLEGASGVTRRGGTGDHFVTTGGPVTLDFRSRQAMPRRARLVLDLRCDDGAPSLPVNLFWSEGGSARFHRDRSTKSLIVNGHAVWEDLGSVLERHRPDVRALRLVLRTEGRCSSFQLSGLSFQRLDPMP